MHLRMHLAYLIAIALALVLIVAYVVWRRRSTAVTPTPPVPTPPVPTPPVPTPRPVPTPPVPTPRPVPTPPVLAPLAMPTALKTLSGFPGCNGVYQPVGTNSKSVFYNMVSPTYGTHSAAVVGGSLYCFNTPIDTSNGMAVPVPPSALMLGALTIIPAGSSLYANAVHFT